MSETVPIEALDRLVTLDDLRVRFLAEASRTFKRARCQADLAPEEVAARAGVAPELVDQVETGDPGDCSLREFVELLQACDQVPFDLAAAPADALRYVIDDPAARATEAAFEDWQARHAVRRALRAATASSR